jgi:competence protein ComEA
MKYVSAVLASLVLGIAAPAFASGKSADKEPLKAGAMIDINTASASELQKLPGIGEPRSAAIISHRPYKQKDDLVSKKIVSMSVYEKIKDNIVATGTTRK